MRNKIFSVILFCTLIVLTACSPAVTEVAPAAAAPAPAAATATVPVEAAQPTTPAATATVEPAKQATTLTVLAAASLTESFTELGELFESKNPDVKVQFSFAGSQQLAQQLSQGAPADVFASANLKYMTAVVEAERVDKSTSQIFARNKLVVVYPKDNPAGISQLTDLSKAGIKLILADKSVPVGNYSQQFLDKAIKDSAFGADYKDKVLANTVSYEQDVKSVFTKVVMGEADAGIVYSTDITTDAADKVGRIDIPDELNTIAEYPIAPVIDAPNPEIAKDFVALVMSAEGQQVLAKYGFIAIP